MYGIVGDMVKTTIYLSRALKERLERVSRERGISEAALIREAVEDVTARTPPRPTLPLFNSGRGDLAERVDEILAEGFGRD